MRRRRGCGGERKREKSKKKERERKRKSPQSCSRGTRIPTVQNPLPIVNITLMYLNYTAELDSHVHLNHVNLCSLESCSLMFIRIMLYHVH